MSLQFMRLFIGDYLRDTTHLNAIEHGGYLLLIMRYFAHGGLPDDDKQLARIACMTEREWRDAKPVLQAFFHSGWRHKRVDAELAYASRITNVRRAAAAKRGIKRSAIDPSNDGAIDTSIARNQNQKEDKKEPASLAADAAPDEDVRTKLFRSGLDRLVRVTGKTPSSARSLIGHWLKMVDDEAVHVMGAIDDALRERVADPVAWITAALLKKFDRRNANGRHRQGGTEDRSVVAAGRRLLERIRSFDDTTGAGDDQGDPAVRVFPKR